MAQVQINQGDTLSTLASKYGTTVDNLMAANKGNAAVKSANLIIAGGSLNIPDNVAAPAAGPVEGTTTPVSGALEPASVQQSGGAVATGELGNLRLALREALNEAGKSRMAAQYQQLAPLTGGVPGTLGSVVSMIRSNTAPTVENVFEDVTSSWEKALELQPENTVKSEIVGSDSSGRYLISYNGNGDVLAKTLVTGPSEVKDDQIIKSGGLKVLGADVADGQQRLSQRRGTDGYADTNTYLSMLDFWRSNGGLEGDFFKYYDPKDYINPNDTAVPQYIRDKVKGDLRTP